MLSGLFDRLREAHSRADVKAIVVTGAKGKFSAGFDINEFVKQAGGGGIDSTCAPTHSQADCLVDLAHSSHLCHLCELCLPPHSLQTGTTRSCSVIWQALPSGLHCRGLPCTSCIGAWRAW